MVPHLPRDGPAATRVGSAVLRRHIPALAGYLGLALILTWPLATHLLTHVPGDGGDDPALVWNLWWVCRALLQAQNPFNCDYMFYPIGINLAFYTLTVLNGCLSMPLQPVIGLIPTSNVLLLSSYVLGAYGAYLLGLEVLPQLPARRGAAWFGGVVYAFAAPKLFYAALGQFNIASSQWAPFDALYMLCVVRKPAWRPALLAALFTAFQAWAEMTYASFLLIFLAILLAWTVAAHFLEWQQDRWRQLARLALATAGMLAVLGLLIAPILANMLPDMLREGDFSVVGGGFADVFSADVAGYLVPTMLHPWLGHLHLALAFTGYDKGQQVFLGWSVWLLTAAGVWAWKGRRDERWLWLAGACVFFLLTLGPVLQVNGKRFGLPMPFDLLAALPIIKANRYPSRYAVMLALCLSVVAAAGLQELSRCWRRMSRWLPGLAVIVFVFENLSVPLPLSNMHIPDLYRELAAAPGDFAVLDLPVGWRNGFRITGQHDVAIMFAQYYQTLHGKRLLGGNTSRNPEFKFQYFSEMPVLSSIIALETGRDVPESVMEADRRLAPAVLAALDVRYVVTRAPAASRALRQYVETVLPVRLLAEQDGVRLYAVSQEQPPGRLDLRLALGEGWGARLETAVAERSAVALVLPGSEEARTLRLTLRGFTVGDQVTLRLDGRSLGTCELGTEWRECRLNLPPLPGPDRVLWLTATRGHDPASLAAPASLSAPASLIAQRQIGSTGVTSPVDICVESAGEEFGAVAHIYVNGREASLNRRGYNLVVLDPTTGTVSASRSFDTFASAEESARLVEFVQSLRQGDIVAVAVADEASNHLTEQAVLALRQLGLAGDLRGCFRCPQAAVGVVGANPGTAAESWGTNGVKTVVIGRGLTEANAYFEIAGVELGASG